MVLKATRTPITQKSAKQSTRVAVFLILASAMALGLSACGADTPADKAEGAKGKAEAQATAQGESEAVLVEVVSATPVTGGADIVATGAFKREREIDLSFRISGVLRQINFREGDLVSRGALVAAIDPTQVQAQIAQAQAQAMQAGAGIGQAQEQARAATSAILSAQAGQSQALANAGQAQAGISRAEASLAQARADLANARRELERDQTLANRGFVSPARLDSRQTRLDVAEASVRAAEAGVVAARQTAAAANAGISASQAGVTQAQASAGAAVAGIRAASGRAQAADAGVSAAAFDRRWASLIAPVSGIVLTRSAEPGEITAPGQPILTLADETSALILRAPVSDRDVARIRIGDPATLRVAAISADLTGEVSRVAERADPRTGAFDVDIRVAQAGSVKTGFFAEARILGTRGVGPDNNLAPPGQTLVPAEALLEATNGKASLFVLQANKTRVRKTQVNFLGFKDGAAIVSGLPAGALVVTAGGAYVSEASLVRVVERPAQ
jgi:multidrug resistance efflux pump